MAFIAKGLSAMGVQTVEVASVASVNRPGSLPPPLLPPTTTGSALTTSDVEKGASSADQWGKNMQRWRNDNIDIGKGLWVKIYVMLKHSIILKRKPIGVFYELQNAPCVYYLKK